MDTYRCPNACELNSLNGCTAPDREDIESIVSLCVIYAYCTNEFTKPQLEFLLRREMSGFLSKKGQNPKGTESVDELFILAQDYREEFVNLELKHGRNTSICLEGFFKGDFK